MTPARRQRPAGRTDPRLARAVFLLLLAVYVATFNGPPGGPDGEVAFQTTSALARRGSLAIGGTPEADALVAHARSSPPGGSSVREGRVAGEFYGWFGVGQALVALPLYGLGRGAAELAPGIEAAHGATRRYGVARSEYLAHLFVGLRNPLLAAWTAASIATMLGILGSSRRAALAAGLGYGLATFAWPQARGHASDVQAACCFTLGLECWIRARGRVSARLALGFGCAAALAFLTRVALAPAVLILDGAFALRLWAREPALEPARRRRLALLASGPQLLVLLAWLALNQLRFGDALDSGYGLAVAGGLFGGDPRDALAGLLVSPGRGLLWMAPGLCLLPLGVSRARRERWGALLRLGLLLALAVGLPAIFLRGWHGAWSYGPRYLLPALPVLWLLSALAFQRSDVDRRLRRAVPMLLAAGLLVQLPGVLVDQATHHDLAVRAAPVLLEVEGATSGPDREAELFEAMQFDWGFAAPWAHWRILRHRVSHERSGSGLEERFPVAEIFRGDSELVLEPTQERERGFRHLAWVDLEERLGGSAWLGWILAALLGLFGGIQAARALEL